MNKNRHIIVMAGLPGNGKSTWVKQFRKLNPYYYIVSRDSIRESIYGTYGFNKKDENLVHQLWMNYIKTLLKSNKNIIVDDTNVVSKNRKKMIKDITRHWGVKKEYKIDCYYFAPNPEENLINRMKDSRNVSKDVWEDVINRMNSQWTTPSEEEGFSEVKELKW
jgi:predicted kinase